MLFFVFSEKIKILPLGLKLLLARLRRRFKFVLEKKWIACLTSIRSYFSCFFKYFKASTFLNTIFFLISLFATTSIPIGLFLNLYFFCRALIIFALPHPISNIFKFLLKLIFVLRNLLNWEIYDLDYNQVLLSQFLSFFIKVQQQQQP